jgi:predicted nuclease with TOPRIM domain
MNQPTDEFYRKRIAELEAENARLRETLDEVKAERRELAERVYGPVPDRYRPTEEELMEVMRQHVPGSGARILAKLGITPRKPE